MKEPIIDITLLQKQINKLQLENQILKDILDQAGISYAHELRNVINGEDVEKYDPNQGSRIIHPEHITADMANLFYSRF